MHVKNIDTSMEERIVTGLIISDNFCHQILPALRKEYFQIEYCKKLFSWIKSYHSAYKKAPLENIKTLYESKRVRLRESESSLIEEFLVVINSKLEKNDSYNVDYEIDQSINYIEKRSLLTIVETIKSLVDKDNTSEAKKVIKTFSTAVKAVSTWVNPLDEEYIAQVMSSDKKGDDKLFKFPGKLGDFIGWIERDWFLGFVGPMKRGKTWFLIECAIQAALYNRKVVFFELEMNHRQPVRCRLRHLSENRRTAGSFIGWNVYLELSLGQRRRATARSGSQLQPRCEQPVRAEQGDRHSHWRAQG